jgi:DNA-directed RNA polymerases I, II, and III subunit RPABC1
LLNILEEKSINRGIIVFPHTMTPMARKVITCHLSSEWWTPGEHFLLQVIVGMAQTYQLEEFAETELLVNITQHTLVPQHEILTSEEKKLLLER